MKILKIKLVNYRTFIDQEIILSGNYTAICGKNDSGKSNIIKSVLGVLFDHDGPFYTPSGQGIQVRTDYPKWIDDDREKEINIGIDLEVSRGKDQGIFDFIDKILKSSPKGETYSVSFQFSFKTKSEPVIVASIDGINIDSLKGEELIGKIKQMHCISFHNSTEPDPNIRFGHMFRDFSEEYADEIDEMKLAVNKSLKKISRTHQGEYEKLVEKMESKIKVGLSISGNEFNLMRYNITFGNSKYDVSLHEWGSGTRNKAVILLAILKAKQLSQATKESARITPILIIEEPECYLHHGAQAQFSRVIQELANEFGVQVITTTHSPYMLSMVRPEQNILIERKMVRGQAMDSVVKIVTSDSWQAPYALSLGINDELLGDYKSLLFAQTDCLLLVEGDLDVKYFNDLKNEKHGDSRLERRIEVFPYGGNGFLANPILIKFLKNKFKNVIITFDLDSKVKFERGLQGIGLIDGRDYLPLGLDKPGRRCIEGLVAEEIKNRAYLDNPDLVTHMQSDSKDEQESAKNRMKVKILERHLSDATVENGSFKEFYKITKSINTISIINCPVE